MMFNEITLVCVLALAETLTGWGGHFPRDYDDRVATCIEVAERADEWGIPMPLAVSLAYKESGFRSSTVSSKKAIGPMQVMPHHHCPDRTKVGCDLIDAGFHALRKYGHSFGCGEEYTQKTKDLLMVSRKSFIDYTRAEPLCEEPDWKETLCHYNQGGAERCGKSARQYAHEVIQRWKRLERQLQTVLVKSGEGG